MKKHMNIPIFIPHEGCPNDCIFCNQRKISGSVHAPSESEMEDIIQRHLATAGPQEACEIAFFGGSFTGLPAVEQEKYLQIAREYVRKGLVHGIRLSTRPDYINEEVLTTLKKYPVKIIELGIQSLDEVVLRKSKRYYKPEDALAACHIIKLYGFSLGVQTMIGLPGDTPGKSLMTAKKLIAVKPDMVRIYPTLVIRETELEREYQSGRYQPLSIDEAVSWCSQLIPLYEAADIRVLRIGLQHTENLQQGVEVIAGPAHSAFGELVYAEIWRLLIAKKIGKNTEKLGNCLIIHVAPSEVSRAVGQHQKNLTFLKCEYGFTSIKVVGDLEALGSPHLEFSI